MRKIIKANAMKKNITYTDEKLKLGERVVDSLPPPSELVMKSDTVKVTLELTRDSVEFFKAEAKRHHVPYQRMLRSLVDEYAKSQQFS